jgi:hypothetical protein
MQVLFYCYDNLLPSRELMGVMSDGTYSDVDRVAGTGADTR